MSCVRTGADRTFRNETGVHRQYLVFAEFKLIRAVNVVPEIHSAAPAP